MVAPADCTIEKLSRQHIRTAFDCGQPALNDWLKLRSNQFAKRGLAQTYVAVQHGDATVLGYYALAAHSVRHEVLTSEQAKGLPKLDMPVLLIGRLAVDRTAQGSGLGSMLLLDALARSVPLAEQIGIRAVEVDAIDDTAKHFYTRFGFTPLQDDPRHLWLSMDVILKLDLPDPRTDQP